MRIPVAVLGLLLLAAVAAPSAAQAGETAGVPASKPATAPPQNPPTTPAKPAAESTGGQNGATKPGQAAPPAAGGPAGQTPGNAATPAKPAAADKGQGAQDATDEDDEDLGPEPAIPKSADPADIAAMRGAQAMLKAEARLKRLLKRGEIKGIDKILTFEEISSWPYQDGLKGMPEAVKKMDGKTVLMTGFMLPIDEVENIKEFLLVQSLWSCCYGQPPDINGIVRVVMKGDKRINYKYDPIKVLGQFRVTASYEDGYCIDIFQLHADEVEVIK